MAATSFIAQDPDYAQRVRQSFERQGAMATIGARLGEITPGRVAIELDWAAGLTQQHGFLHAGMVATASCRLSAGNCATPTRRVRYSKAAASPRCIYGRITSQPSSSLGA